MDVLEELGSLRLVELPWLQILVEVVFYRAVMPREEEHILVILAFV